MEELGVELRHTSTANTLVAGAALPSNENRPEPGSSWLRATFAGWLAGFFLAVILIIAVDSAGIPSKAPLGLGMGLGVGWAQRRVARDWLYVDRGWLMSCVWGLVAPMLAYDLGRFALPSLSVHIALFVVIGGILIGILQWRLLRTMWQRAAWWIPASIVGWGLAGSTVIVSDRYLPKIPGLAGAGLYVFVILVGGILLGFVQRSVIRRMTRSRVERSAHL